MRVEEGGEGRVLEEWPRVVFLSSIVCLCKKSTNKYIPQYKVNPEVEEGALGLVSILQGLAVFCTRATCLSQRLV